MFSHLLTFTLLVSSTIGRKLSRDGDNSQEFVDLGYSINEDTIYFPGQREFTLSKDFDMVTNNETAVSYSAYSFCMAEHGGTHVDAPFHFYNEGWTMDKIPSSHMIDIPAAVIDVEELVNKEATPGEFLLKVEHLIEYEKMGKEIPFKGVVIIKTGWAKYWPNKIKYLGWDNATEEGKSKISFPGVSLDAAKWLANERQIVGLGIDTPSVDVGSAKTAPTHVFLAKKNVYNIENVANLHLVSSSTDCDLHLFVMPLKIVGATGAPTRILAYCK